jgi:hypothetical protein
MNQPVKRDSFIWPRADADWYVEPNWCSERLFAVEPFTGTIWDPACGMGRIVAAAKAAGLSAFGTDVVDRGCGAQPLDFLKPSRAKNIHADIVCNPPFDVAKEFALRALELAKSKVAIIFPVRRLNAARWLEQTPLARVWLLTPRPSMPPGEVIMRGEKAGNGTVDFCWLVFQQGYQGRAELAWLHREQD